MAFSSDILIRTVIFILSVSGFMVARYIYKHTKPEHRPLVCPLNFNCEAVIHSNYSRFLGVPLEIFGMIYYALMSISYFILIFMPDVLPTPLIGFLIIASLSAFLFSIYLVCVQIFILKEGCFWCLISTFISVLIFILTVLAYDFSYIAKIFI